MAFWQLFLRKSYETMDHQLIQTHKWVEYLVRDGLLPLLKAKQYNLTCKPQELAECILNHLIRHERDYNRCRFTTYQCKHREEVCIEEYEFYEEMIPDSIWNQLKKEFYIDWFADSGAFAERIWRSLPLIVFDHLSMDSPVNQILYEKMKTLEDEEDSEGYE